MLKHLQIILCMSGNFILIYYFINGLNQVVYKSQYLFNHY